jgi:Tat protein secretion system quality control protein TatD with DNase activity
MNIAKQVIVLIGENTKYHTKYIQWEIELAKEMSLPIIVANLDCCNRCNDSLCHPSLKMIDSIMHVPFGPHEIKFAIDNFSSKPNNPEKRGHSWYYKKFD